jgi:Ca-activated chloride channel homolog
MLLPSARTTPPFFNLSAVVLRLSVTLLVVVCACGTLLSVPAQEPGTDDEVLKVSTDLLVFPIRIRDKRSASTQLSESDLSLDDKDHATGGLYLFRGADRVALLFALDESGSLRKMISQQREAALALFRRFGDRSKVAVLRFGETPSLVSDFGRDSVATGEAFNFPARKNQHTAIFNGALAALNAFDVLPPFRSERRIVVLISDGLDNASSTRAGEVIELALKKRVSFYVVHLPLFEPRNGRLAVRPTAKGFRDLADKTGGRYFLVGDAASTLLSNTNQGSNDLTPIFQAIEDDLRSQYLLGFYAGAGSRDGREHRFKVSFPAGVEYQTARAGYSRTHQFFIKLPANGAANDK